jgi:hypothetical protein
MMQQPNSILQPYNQNQIQQLGQLSGSSGNSSGGGILLNHTLEGVIKENEIL